MSATRGVGDGYRGLADAAGCGVDQHLVAGFDASQIIEAVPGGGVRGGHRRGLGVGQARRQRGGQAGVAGDKGAPTAIGRHAADVLTDLMFGDIGSDGRHHAGEIGTQPRQQPVEGRIAPEGDQDVGEVDAGRADRDLDLPGTRRNSLGGSQFHGLQVTGRPDLQALSVVRVVQHGGVALFGPQRSRTQPGGVPLVGPPGGLVFFGAGQQLARQLLGVGLRVDVDVGGAQVGVLGADHPQQPAQPGLLQVGAVVGQHRLRTPGQRVQPGRLARDFRQLAARSAPRAGRNRCPGSGARRTSGSARFGGASITTPVNPPSSS